MKEFIVWDKVEKKFYKNKNIFGILQDGTLVSEEDGIYLEDSLSNEFIICRYICKKDINNNKIYDDCSIVEFILKDKAKFADFTGSKPTIWNEIKMIGYFTFNDEDLRYEIDIIDWEKSKTKSQFSCLYYNFDSMSNFKIIDTIQENKLGLIK